MTVFTLATLTLLLVLAAIGHARRPRPPERSVTIDEVGVTRIVGGKVERVTWEDLVQVGILTTSEGPWAEDVWWILVGSPGGVAVPNGEVGDLVARVSRLPGADLDAIIRAMGSTDDASFPVWSGERGAGAVCAAPGGTAPTGTADSPDTTTPPATAGTPAP